ncbi:unnamed protein product [Brassicogethes aeneus]|uniref:C2H2-type domain-containing protein n=1 Tax=Brassicogethes aeneus TaxID=1431903 RepID=A0A9P0AWS4_BRAAE|nr:unnamed protein product [Brassicogethes aeneus]
MEQIVKKELEELVDDSKGDISMNYDKPSTSADKEMPFTFRISIKQEIKEELDEESYNPDDRGETKDIIRVYIKEERRESDFSEEYDNNKEEQYVKLREKLFKCEICSKKYQTEDSLCNHKKHVHKDMQELFNCAQCKYQTLRKSDFKKHLKIHDKKTYYLKCQYCPYTAAEVKSLNSHLLSKHKEENKTKITSKIHHCAKCLYSTVNKSSYNDHIKVCLKLKNIQWYQCEFCRYKTIHKSHLTTHIKTHNRVKELKCLFCIYQCNKKQSLDSHILIKHSNLLNETNKTLITSKLHSCEHCNYKTTLANNLKLHLKCNH